MGCPNFDNQSTAIFVFRNVWLIVTLNPYLYMLHLHRLEIGKVSMIVVNYLYMPTLELKRSLVLCSLNLPLLAG